VWWCVYYDRGEFSSADGSPFDAPRTGVVAIAQEDPACGYRILHSQDYYYWEPGLDGWHNTDLIGTVDHLVRCRQPLVLFGRMISTDEYQATLRRIHERHGPKKSWRAGEVRR
jgi:hypothetical protein